MPRKLTSATTLEHLRREAKRWLKAVRANDPEALARLQLAYPAASATAALREVQHALAREYGHNSWTELKHALAQRTAPPRDVASPVERFLECACPDHHVRGLTAHRMATHAAMRVLE